MTAGSKSVNKLFMVYLGGAAPGANIELHDIQFVISEHIEQALPELKARWFGEKNGLHMDSYRQVHGADGYRIKLSNQPPENTAKKLFFVNVGGYRAGEFSEAHEFDLFVASDAAEAKQKALACLLKGVPLLHKDNLKDVDNCLPLSLLDEFYIHLEPSDEVFTSEPDWVGYELL